MITPEMLEGAILGPPATPKTIDDDPAWFRVPPPSLWEKYPVYRWSTTSDGLYFTTYPTGATTIGIGDPVVITS